MLNRTDFFKTAALLSPLAYWNLGEKKQTNRILVNDVHSQLNSTKVAEITNASSVDAIRATIKKAAYENRAISVAGGRHAMGNQQFGTDTVLLDMNALNKVLNFNPKKRLVEVEAGIQWPQLIKYLLNAQKDKWPQWGIIQKQTGADRLSIGGALSANVHGRGLRLKPIIQHVESFDLINADGDIITCNRKQNPQLFRLAIGGYGLFGIIVSVKLKLARRTKLKRVVEIVDIEDLMPAFEERIANGYLYGDFQFSTATKTDDFLRKGVFSCYVPIEDDSPIPDNQKALSEDDWRNLLYLAHTDKKKAFGVYSNYYLSTSGQLYWSDTHQMTTYLDNYHYELSRKIGTHEKASEMITEICVPRAALVNFMDDVREDFCKNDVDLIYGTIRLIEKDDESFMPWAKDNFVCIIFNLHIIHNKEILDKAAGHFRRLIDLGIKYGGSYFLTYHRWATLEQVLTCYPQFPEFLRLKRKYDSDERFQSDWYRHYKEMFADLI